MALFVNRLVGAILLTTIIGMVLGFIADAIYPVRQAAKPGYAIAVAAAPAATAPAAAEAAATSAPAPAAAAVAPIADRLKTADAKAGAALMSQKCAMCHDWSAGGPNKIGPNLHDVVGRVPGTKAGFAYSAGMIDKGKGGAWDAARIDEFITSPKDVVSGTKMTFAGLSDPADRANVIAYLQSLAGN